MANPLDDPSDYQIRVQGVLDHKWADWFDGMAIKPQENGETVLVGSVADQPALHGLLSKIRDLGLTLLALERVERG